MMEEARKRGETSKTGETGDGGLPQELQDELDKLAEENMKQQLDELEKQLDELKKELDAADSPEKKKEIQEKMKKLFGEKESLENGEKNTVPWDKLSDELKEKLQEIYNKLPKEARQELEKKAKETLEKLDDELIMESRGKLSEDDKPPTHEELETIEKKAREDKDEEEESERRQKEAAKALEKLKKALETQINEGLAEYDKIYQEIAPIADEFYNSITKIFLPHKHPRYTKGHPTGQRVDLAKAMQFQADKSLYDKLWQRRTTPEKIDYRFTLLVDLSYSMKGKKIEQTFRGVILMAEVLNRLGIKTKIYGFQDDLILYKDFNQDLSPALREEMLIMRKEVSNNGRNNQSAWNSDGYCLEQASQDLQKSKGKDSFLIVFSDGLPVPDSKHAGKKFDLHKVIENIRKNTKQKLIGVGLGPDTEHVKDFYPTSLPNLRLKDIPATLGALLEDMIKNPAKYK
jgi:midasin (ATPase involved in ribosome maturation)